MGSNVRNALYLSVATVFFMSAVFIGFFLFNTVSNAVDETYEANQQLDRNQQMILQEAPREDLVSGEIVFQSIYQIKQTGIPVEVDGEYFPYKDWQGNVIEIEDRNLSNIYTWREYVLTHERSGTGELETIVYTTPD